MNLIQKITCLVIGEKVELETRKWLLECTGCGHSGDLWNAGGVRIANKGSSRASYGRCSECRQYKMMRVIRKDGQF